MKGLSRKQQVVYAFIKDQIEGGIPPTRAEICSQFSYKSINSAELMIKAIIKKGYLVHVPGISRGLRFP